MSFIWEINSGHQPPPLFKEKIFTKLQKSILLITFTLYIILRKWMVVQWMANAIILLVIEFSWSQKLQLHDTNCFMLYDVTYRPVNGTIMLYQCAMTIKSYSSTKGAEQGFYFLLLFYLGGESIFIHVRLCSKRK